MHHGDEKQSGCTDGGRSCHVRGATVEWAGSAFRMAAAAGMARTARPNGCGIQRLQRTRYTDTRMAPRFCRRSICALPTMPRCHAGTGVRSNIHAACLAPACFVLSFIAHATRLPRGDRLVFGRWEHSAWCMVYGERRCRRLPSRKQQSVTAGTPPLDACPTCWLYCSYHAGVAQW